jgi:hypothetical protein
MDQNNKSGKFLSCFPNVLSDKGAKFPSFFFSSLGPYRCIFAIGICLISMGYNKSQRKKKFGPVVQRIEQAFPKR